MLLMSLHRHGTVRLLLSLSSLQLLSLLPCCDVCDPHRLWHLQRLNSHALMHSQLCADATLPQLVRTCQAAA